MGEAPSFCPYVGLRPFDAEHHDYFFGRAADVRVVASTALAVPISILYGASGVGKSSVLLAGVIPDLGARQGVVALVYREWQLPDALAEIKARCIQAANRLHGAPLQLEASWPLDELLSRVGRQCHARFVIVLDQFEEYFLYHPKSEESPFDSEFARSVNREDVDAGFVISMREDSLSALDRFKSRIPNLLGNAIRLSHLDRDSAIDAIVKPLERFNERYGAEPPYRIEPDLVALLLEQLQVGADVAGDAARAMPERIETPLLQLVMTRLWEEKDVQSTHLMRVATFRERLQGVRSLVQTHLNEVMSALSDADRALCARFFDRLVTPSGLKFACRLDDLSKWAEADSASVRAVAENLDSRRILRGIDPPPGQTQRSYEIFHDVLAPAILAWRQRYLAEQREREQREQAVADAQKHEREAARQAEMLSAQALAAEQKLRAEAERDRADAEARRATAARRFVWALSVMTAFAIAMAWVAFVKRDEARHHEDAAVRNGNLAFARELAGHARGSLDSDPELSVILALHATTVAQPVPPEITSALNEAVFTSRIRGTVGPRQGHKMFGARYSPDGSVLITVADDGKIEMLDSRTLESRTLPRALASAPVPNGRAIAFSPDSQLLATASVSGDALVWNLRSGERAMPPLAGRTAWISEIAFSPTEQVIAASSADGVIVWSLVNQQRLLRGPIRPQPGQFFNTLAFAPDGSRIATGSTDHDVVLWDAHSGKVLLTLKGHTAPVEAVSFSHDGKRLVSAGMDARAIVWDTRSGTQIETFTGHRNTVFDARFGTQDRLIATASADGVVEVWDAASGQEMFSLNGHSGVVQSLDFGPGSRLATASSDGTVRIWNVSPLHLKPVTNLVFSRDGSRIATTSLDNTVMIWDARSGEALSTLRGFTDTLTGLNLNADGTRLVTADARGLVIVWDAKLGRPLFEWKKHGLWVDDVAFSPKGTFVAASGEDGWVNVRNAESGNVVGDLEGEGYELGNFEFSRDESSIAVGDKGGDVLIWGLPSGARRLFSGRGRLLHAACEQQDSHWPVERVAFSPDGHYLASVSADATGCIWEAATGRPLHVLRGHSDQVYGLAFNPSGTRLATGSLDGTAAIWDTTTGERLQVLSGHRLPVMEVFFSPDGKYLATASFDHTAKLWDVQSGGEILSLSHPGPVTDAAFSPDGTVLATAGGELAPRLNILELDALTNLARQRITRTLTEIECGRYLHEVACPDH